MTDDLDIKCIAEATAVALVQGELITQHPQILRHLEVCAGCHALVVALVRMKSVRPAPSVEPSLPTVPAALVGPRAASAMTLPTRDPQRYVRGHEIARGGMGRIVSAYDLELGRRIAIKELLATAPALERRFEREVQITARLQHPSIIAVQEAGRWPEGEPFYAMQHVEGRALDRVIENTAPTERMSLLPHVSAVADALAYAHSLRVIHRDLKPGNILVGAYGETIVIDWGLAKQLGEADEPAPIERTHVAEADQLTVLGQMMGTPCYMPPEQAEGRPVDERADVYAIGAILYHLLAGRKPYVASKSVEEAVAAVIAGPPVALEDLAPETPTDLVAIVTKAMARDPALRYRTAAKLADDLKRYLAGQLVTAHRYSSWQLIKRWVGRHRAAVGVATIATLALTVTTALGILQIRDERDDAEAARATAEVARATAQARRGEVEGLLDFMLGDLHARLQPLGKLELLDVVAQKALAYHAKEPPNENDSIDARRRMVALTNVAQVYASRGNHDEALASYRASLAIAERNAAMQVTDLRAHHDVATCHGNIAGVLGVKGDLAGSLEAAQKSIAIFERVIEADPTNLDWQVGVSLNYDHASFILASQRRFDEALANQRKGVAIAKRVAARDPANATWQDALATSLNTLGFVRRRRFEPKEALPIYRESLAIVERLVAADPNNTQWQNGLALAHAAVGDLLSERNDLDGAASAFGKAVAILEMLARNEPSNTLMKPGLANFYNLYADVRYRQRKFAEALAAYRSAQALIERMLVEQPENPLYQRVLAKLHEGTGNVAREQGRLDEALRAYQAASEICERVLQQTPDDVNWQVLHFEQLRHVGDLLVAQKRTGEARRHLQRGLAIAERLVAANVDAREDVRKFRELLARCCP